MEDMIFGKDKIHELVEKASEQYTVIAPKDNEGVVLFRPITKSSEMTLEFTNAKIPVKAVLFQQTETLFTFSRGKSVTVNSPENRGKTLIVGVRPCDAKSLAVLDAVFGGEYEDTYITRKENITIIALSCITPGVNCFCTSVGGGPFSGEYADIQLTDIGESYYVEVNSEKGEDIIESTHKLFTPAARKDLEKKKELEKKAIAAIHRYMHTENLVDVLDTLFESSFWKESSRKCLGCAVCTYVCPTCYCFDMQDETVLTKGARIRVWDSCMYPEYTLQASGYNPRPERMNRMRNRVYHKFSYFLENCNMIACVGCGRCIEVCPVNIDIIDVINRTSEVKL